MSYTLASPEWILELRTKLGLTQSQLAERMGVTYVTISRWESGQNRPNKLARKALTTLAQALPVTANPAARTLREKDTPHSLSPSSALVDFQSDAETVRLFVEGERLRYGHLFSPTFGTETALIDPLPHQFIAVYKYMLPQPRLRFLLADDAGAGKTIMAGLYIREMLARRLIRRVLIVPPAGLVSNWKSEMRKLFSLHFREVTGFDCQADNPFAGPGSDLALVSVDGLASGRAFDRLADAETAPYDLVIFDEAHKLSASRNADLTYDSTDRYKLAELVAGVEPLQDTRSPRRLPWHAHHLLLLTATPHMGKDFPYYALWRLLEPAELGTVDAFNDFPEEMRRLHFLRRSKEEMVRYDRSRIYPTRVSQTAGYDLSPLEGRLYQEMTTYVRTHYNRARILNRSAARLAMSVLQRRAASSTWALLCSLQRRRKRLDDYIGRVMAQELTEQQFRKEQQAKRVPDMENDKTSDEEAAYGGREERDAQEDEAMGATSASTLGELQAEHAQVEELLSRAQEVYDAGEEAKFERLREVLLDTQFKEEKLLIFTEHRDTMDFLVKQLQGMGYTGEIARIHGGMPYQERDAQKEEFRKRCRFMVATDAAGEGINLQFCWIMVNYDIPWNPARMEQRFGRIHRYNQNHDPVVLVNLVANNTREGKVLGTLLSKLELIRKEMGSDKVFDVIGRQFQGKSLSEIIVQAVVEDRADEKAREVEGSLTTEQVRALEEADAKLKATGGDVASQLPALIAQREQDLLQRMLPGYVRRFVERSARQLGIVVQGDMNGRFQLERLPIGLAIALEEATEGQPLSLTVNKPDLEDEVLFLRPGEHFFDRYRAYYCDRQAEATLRGGVFADPYATEPYLYHLTQVTVMRRADASFLDAFAADQALDVRLIALRQPLNGEPFQCAVELLMILRPLSPVPPTAWPAHSQVGEALTRAQAYLETAVARPLAEERRQQLAATVASREAFLEKGFDYQEADLLESRIKIRDQVVAGDQAAKRRLEEVRGRQQALKGRKEHALAVLRREPELVEPGEVTFLAHALILPSADPDDRERHNREIERIAMQVARAYEESKGASIQDVSTPESAWVAGFDKLPGFDLLSRRPQGERRCIEVKGRRAVGDVELTENEWAKAANLREQYWLYVVYDCVAAYPRLLRVQDPFAKLLVRVKGGVVIGEASVFESAEPDKEGQ